MYITAKEARNQLGISSQTLNTYRRKNKIDFIEINSRKFLYDISRLVLDIPKLKKNVVYARVSNTKQEEDLDKQIKILSEFMVTKGLIVDYVFSDVASGMNEDRKGFNKLVKEVTEGYIDTIYISYKDRLTRFGYGYIEKWFSLYGAKIVYINFTKEEDFQTELTEDLISIIHHFSMKMYSNRRKVLKLAQENLRNINL